MNITYIGHSGFSVELADMVLIFDYFKGILPEFDKSKEIYVFASHAHYDHFQREIFTWSTIYPHITYILSDDIKASFEGASVVKVAPNKEVKVGRLDIRTLKSTDEGVAFLVKTPGKYIYHAGDLNWWHWEEESAAFNSYMKKRYKAAIAHLEGETIDAAFVPLDSRQGAYYYLGMDWFMRNTDTKHVFPMHMSGDYNICDAFLKRPESEPFKASFKKITGPHQIFEVKE